MIETQLTTDFECIFNYAKSDFEISWNDANDLFFNTILNYTRYNKFHLYSMFIYLDNKDLINMDSKSIGKEVDGFLNGFNKEKMNSLDLSDKDKAMFILGKFMLANLPTNAQHLLVLN
jgi:hypothetical protein